MSNRTRYRLVLAALVATLLASCQDGGPSDAERATAFLETWFTKASAGQRGDELCHGLGTLKHPQFSCADMLTFAADVDGSTRTYQPTRLLKDFAGVPGKFLETEIESTSRGGESVRETAVLKEDDGNLRLYWYRSDLMLKKLQAEADAQEEEKHPEQKAYDELVARYPVLYAYPPCYGVRPSSSNLAGELVAMDEVDVDVIEGIAAECGAEFCFSVVGQKIAPLCPAP